MANNGNPGNSNVGRGLSPLPRIHLSRSLTRGNDEILISLTQPRPQPDREANVYIETPFKYKVPSSSSAASTSSNRDKSTPFEKAPSPCVKKPKSLPVTAQPRPVTFRKDISNENEGHDSSIICKSCKRCTCEPCRRVKPLPSKWLCHDEYLCSAKTCVELCSCVCCIKAFFYHCSKDADGDTDGSSADKPCSCAPHRWCYRWGCMGALSLVLPCLCLYWPLRGCTKLCELGYQKCSQKGCQCETNAPPHQENKLLSNASSNC